MTPEPLERVLSGAPYRRPLAPELIEGRGQCVGDIEVQGCLEAVFVRSWAAHGVLNNVDVSIARDAEGVFGAFSARDLPDLPPVPPPPLPLVHGGIERPSLARDRVRYVGEPVAVVLADDRYVGEDATEMVDIDIDPLPVVTDPLEAAQSQEAPLFEGRSNVVFEHASGTPREETNAVLDTAPVVVDISLRNERLSPTPLEGRAILVVPTDGGLTVFCSHQAPHRLKDALCGSFSMDATKVRVIVPNSGGAFGQKSHTFPEYLVLAHLAMLLERPIRWVEDRRESFISSTHGRGQTQRVRLAANHEGQLLAMDASIDADVGAYPHTGAIVPLFTALVMSGPYRIPAISVTTRSIVTNTCPTAPYRGAGRPEAAYAVERAMNLLAHRLSMDPAALRMKNFVARDEFPYRSPTGALYDSGDFAAGLSKALELADYDAIRQQQRETKERLIGIGICSYIERSGGQDGSTEFGEVEVLPSGRVVVRTGSNSTGQDHATSLTKLAGNALDIDPETINLCQGDTDFVASGTGTFASRSMQVGGSAIVAAARDLIHNARGRAAERLEASEADLVFQAGAFSVYGSPTSTVSLAELAADERLVAESEFIARQAFPSGSYIAVVEIDPETGMVSVKQLVAVDDCGTVIDQIGTKGQVVGSIAQGLGQVLYEEFVYDEEGQPLTSSMMDYLLPTSLEMPTLTLGHIHSPSPFSVTGAKGAGEAGCIGVPPAIANAIEDALRTGIERMDPPLTPEKVWRMAIATKASSVGPE